MKKSLVAMAAAVIFSTSVVAQSTEIPSTAAAGGSSVTALGSLTVASLTAIGVTAAVAAAIVSNAQQSGVLPETPVVTPPGTTTTPGPVFTLVCNSGDAAPVNGVCTNNSTTVTVTGTGTATSTVTVPVIVTYPAIATIL